jgi:hypothetical protein
MTSRRGLLQSGTAALLATQLYADQKKNRYEDIQARIARRDFRDIYKEDLPTPCMVVDLPAFEQNLRTMADHCRTSGINLRGHVKVHKSRKSRGAKWH